MAKKGMVLRLESKVMLLVACPMTRREDGGGEGIHFLAMQCGREGKPTDQCGSQSGALRVRLVNLVVDRI